MKYIVINNTNIVDFEKSVNDMIKVGWDLYGDMNIEVISWNGQYADLMFYQAMIKKPLVIGNE